LPELATEVSGVEPAFLQLQDHLAQQQLVWTHGQRPAERQLAAVESGDVVFPAVQVLHVNAPGMAERRHAGAEHVRPLPKTAAENKGQAPFFPTRVGARNL